MKKDDKASISLKKVISISIILLFIMGIGVMAASSKLNNVKIILSDGYEMDVLTSKTKISEILDENHIILLPTENVIPSLDEEISDNKTIRIAQNGVNSKETEIVSEELSMEKVLADYNSVTEKIIKEQVTIAYETETKDLSTGNGQKEVKIVQNGVDGLKEISYKVKYLNGQEVEKIQISENVIQNPVNCIKEIRNKKVVQVTSRSSSSVSTSAPSVSNSTSSLASKVSGMTPKVTTLNASAYCAASCGGNTKTACGATAKAWYTVAAGKGYAMGTIIYIPYFANQPNGGWFIVQDRGGAITNNKLDVYMSSYSECINFGRRNLECYIYEF
ncbi:MAG: G5 domain-containing protein [Clostridia bacterium]|nr:G5 domain-containing protein [Clostridia bacterium]